MVAAAAVIIIIIIEGRIVGSSCLPLAHAAPSKITQEQLNSEMLIWL